MATTDDPVVRIVEAAMETQTRLILAYMEQMRTQVTLQTMEAQTRLILAYMEQMRTQVTLQTVAALRAEFGGEQVHIGKRGDGGHRERDAAIRRDAVPAVAGGLGLSLRALARNWHLSKTQITRILAAECPPLPDPLPRVEREHQAVSPCSLKNGTGGVR